MNNVEFWMGLLLIIISVLALFQLERIADALEARPEKRKEEAKAPPSTPPRGD